LEQTNFKVLSSWRETNQSVGTR